MDNKLLKNEILLNKRDMVLLAANKLFRQKGYNGTSMQDIAESVSLLKGSLYYYFKNKEEILYELLSGSIERLLEIGQSVEVRRDLSARERLRELVKLHVGHLTSGNATLEFAAIDVDKLSESHQKIYLAKRVAYVKIWDDILLEGMRQKEFPTLDLELTSKAVRGIVNWLFQWYKLDESRRSEEIGDYFSHLICDLLLSELHA